MIDDEKLKTIFSIVLKIDKSSVTEDLSMDDLEEWDSLRHMNLILALEEEFGVTIPDEEAADLSSYKLVKLVLNELKDAK